MATAPTAPRCCRPAVSGPTTSGPGPPSGWRSGGWLAADGALTEAGRAGYRAIEDTTDRLAASAYAGIADAELDRLATALRPLADRIVESNALPFPNPIGVDPRP